ncbi:MAG: hypothetical protein HW413_2339 [Thermoleophilia bacterium]|nr:hypothetical protein [Thermoleophilia bacterium]
MRVRALEDGGGEGDLQAPARGHVIASARAGDALELVEERLAARLDYPGLAGSLALVRGPDAVGYIGRLEQPESLRDEVFFELRTRQRRVGPAGADGLNPDIPLGELRCDRAHEADDRVFR